MAFMLAAVGGAEAAEAGGSSSQIRLRPLVYAVSLLLAMSAHADYQAGLDAYDAGDFEKALAEWKAEVDGPQAPGNLAVYREALYGIGMLYWQGEGVDQDYTVAAVWLRQAADINHPGAQNKLGYLYSTGQGVPQNYQQARHWFELAAEQGDPDASYNLGRLNQGGAVAEAGTAASPEPGSDASVAWILDQNPEYYTIQVIALRSDEKLRTFIAEHNDWKPFATYTPVGNEKPLSVLVQGAYPDLASARAAAAAFPPGLQSRESLWIRKFKMVQGMVQ